MKMFMRKILAICIVASVSVMAFGCSDEGDKNKVVETIAPGDADHELQFFYNNPDGSEDFTENEATEAEATEADPVDTTAAEPVTELVTEYVEVTDADGQQVTEADGSVQTEVATEYIEIVPTNTEAQTNAETEAAYTPSYDTCKAYWLKMSQQGDTFFNGEFLVIEFQINEDIPDGSYPVSIATTDIGSWELVTHVPEIINGEVTVGDAQAAEQPTASADDFTLTVNNVSGNQGDTVKLVIDLKNNPGFCGFVIDVQYDANALTIVDTYGGADFNNAISYVS